MRKNANIALKSVQICYFFRVLILFCGKLLIWTTGTLALRMYGDPKEETDGTELGRPKKLPGYQLVEEEGSHVDHIEEAVAYYDLVDPRLLFSVDDHCCDQIDDDNCREHCGKCPRIFRLLIYNHFVLGIKCQTML